MEAFPVYEFQKLEFDPRDEGAVVELISGRLSGSQDLNVGVFALLPGEYHIRHHHPYGSEFYFFLDGACVLTLDGEDFEAERGTAAYIPVDCVHAVRNVGPGRALFLYGLSKPEYDDMGLIYDE